MDSLNLALKERRRHGNLRELKIISGVDFCSNDYLGLAQHPLEISTRASGSTGSRLISGHDDALERLEARISTFHGCEAALLFSSGYAANTGLLACIAGRDDAIVSDELIHASLIDGIRLSYARRERFYHNDLSDLEAKLKVISAEITGQIYVVVEALYSMDGDRAPLLDISTLCRHFNGALIVDEAHSVAVYGDKGRGLVCELGLQEHVFAVVHTFGKGPGYHGAAIVGSRTLRDYLVNFCRPFIYTTAPSPQTVAETDAAYTRFQHADDQREALRSVLTYFESHVKSPALNGAHWLPSDSAIQGLVIPGNERAKACADFLQKNGFAVKAILSPTVANGAERLRISLHSFNTRGEMDKLASCLVDHLNKGAS